MLGSLSNHVSIRGLPVSRQHSNDKNRFKLDPQAYVGSDNYQLHLRHRLRPMWPNARWRFGLCHRRSPNLKCRGCWYHSAGRAGRPRRQETTAFVSLNVSGDGSFASTHNFVSTSWFPRYKHSVFLWGLGPVRNENLSTGCSCLHQFLSTVKYLSSDSSCLPTPAVYSVSCPQLSAVNIVPVYSNQLSTDIIPEDRISHKLWNRFQGYGK